ncbi:hypothetical protein ABIB49_000470 [Arthrobacter sp. UYCu512]
MNAHLNTWLTEIEGDHELSSDARAVALALSRSVGIGRIAFTNWQRLNTSLGRNRTDNEVLFVVRELQAAGYLGRYQGNRFDQSRGWSLTFPEANA